jgi:hypothetical protein
MEGAATRIDDADATHAALSAHYRFSVRMAELQAQFEQKASEVRSAYLSELDGIQSCEASSQNTA